MLNPPFLPKYSRQSRSPSVTKGGTFYYPYMLAYATGVLDKAGVDVYLKDAVAEEWSRQQTMEYAAKLKPSLVVVDTGIPSFENDVAVAEEIKKATNAHVCMVGWHCMDKKKAFDFSDMVDSICRGEYDYAIRDLAETLEERGDLSTVQGLSFRDEDGEIVDNPDRPLIQNLDELPYVSEVYKKHLGMKGIKKYFYASLLWPQVTIKTARGCAHNCSFCPIPFKASYRARSPQNVVGEFVWIEKNLPEVKEVQIEDPTFPLNEARTKEICRLLVEKGVKLKWSCNARVNMKKETLQMMKDAGCRLLCVGFETPSLEVLNAIHKGTTEEMQMNFMKNCRAVGLLVNGCFILGLPNDTRKTMQETIEFAKRLNCDTAQFYPLMCYPGTEAYEWARTRGVLESDSLSALLDDKGHHRANVKGPEGMSSDELVAWCDKALKEFYLRGDYILYKLQQSLTNYPEAIRTMKSAKVFFIQLPGMILKTKKIGQKRGSAE